MANESENSCGKPPVPAAVATAAGAAPRRSCRARRLNTRFVNDEVDEGYRQLVARIAAPDSHSILQSPQLAFHHLSPAPPPQPTTSLPTTPSSKTSVVAVTATATNASSSTVAHAKKGIVPTVTSVRKPSVVKQVRRHSQESVNSEKDSLTGKRLHQGSVDCEGSHKSVTIRNTAKLIGNSVKKIKASVPSLKSQKSKKNRPASPVSDPEDDIPLANLVSKGSAAASECSSDDELPLAELAARNKQVDSESYNCDLPSNYCIKTIHNPDLSSTPISIVCIEDPDEVDQLETPKVRKVKRKSFPKMFNIAKKTKLDLSSATSNEKSKCQEGLSMDHAVDQSTPKVKRKTPPLPKESVGKKESKEGKHYTKSKVKLPLKPNQGKLLKILNLKVVPTSLPELPKDSPLVKLIENKNADPTCSETNHERTTIKFAVFSPKIPSGNTESDKDVLPVRDQAKNCAITRVECAKDGLTQTPSNKPTTDATSAAVFTADDLDSQKGTDIKGAAGTYNTHEVGTLIPKQEANHSSVSGQPNAGQVNYNALSSILKSESPPCMDGLINVEMTSGKSTTRNESTTDLPVSLKLGKSQILASKITNKGSDCSKLIQSGTTSPIPDTTTCLTATPSRSLFEQNLATLLVTKTELYSEQSQASEVSSPLPAQTKYGAQSSQITVPAAKKDECWAVQEEENLPNKPSKCNAISTDELNSSNSSNKTTPNKILKDNLQDEAKIKCKRRSESSPSGGSICKKLKQETNESPKANKSTVTNSSNSALYQGLSTDRSPLKSEKVAINDPHSLKDDPAPAKAAARPSRENAVFSAPKQLKADPYEQKPDLAILRDTREQWETDDKSTALVPPLPPRNEEKLSMAKKEGTPKVKMAKKVSIESNNVISPNRSSYSSVNKNSIQDSLTRNVIDKDLKGVSPPSASIDSKVDIKPALLITKIIDGIETEVKPYVKRREQPSSPKVNDSTNNRESKSTTASNKSCEPSAKYQKIDHLSKSKSVNPIVKSEPLDTSPVVVSLPSSRKREPDTVQAIDDMATAKQKEKSKERKDKENKTRSNMEKEKNKITKSKMEKESSGMESKTKDYLGKGVTKEEKVTETKESSGQDPKTDVNKTIIKEHKAKGNGEGVQKRDQSVKINTGKGGHTKGTTEKADKTKKITDQDRKAKVITEKDIKVKESVEKETSKGSREKVEKVKKSLENLYKDKEKAKGRIDNDIKGKEKSITEKESKVKEAKSSKGTINAEDKMKGKGDKENSAKDNQLKEEKSKSGIKKETKELTSEGSRKESRDKSPSGHRSSSSSKEHHHRDEAGNKASRSKSSHHRRSSSSDHKVKDDRNGAKRRDSSSSLSSKFSRIVGDRGDTKQLKKRESSSPTPVDDSMDHIAISVNASNSLMDSDKKIATLVNNSEQLIILNKIVKEQKSVTLGLPNTVTKAPSDVKPPQLQESVAKAANVEETPDKNTVLVAKKEIHKDVIDQKPISSVTELLNMCRANIPVESAPRQRSPVLSSVVLVGNSLLLDSKPQTVNSLESLVVSAEEAFKRASPNLPHSVDVKPFAAGDELVGPISRKNSTPNSDASEDEEEVTHHLEKYSDTCAVLLERMKEFDDVESSEFSIQRHGLDSSVEMGNYLPSATKAEFVLVNNTSVDGSASPVSNSSSPSPSPTKRVPSPSPPETVEERERREALEAKRELRNMAVVEERMKMFEHLTENLYLTDRKKSKQSKEVRRMVCDCTLTKEELSRGEKGCGDDCLNRLLMIECGWRCPIGDACLNRRFQLCEYGPVEVFNAEEKGCGVKATQQIPPGTFILEYVGEVFDQREFRRRRKEYGKDGTAHFYFMALRADQFIDATKKGNISRFVNHSCDPNAETQKWTVNGELRIGFFSTKAISEGEEINFDYRMERYGREPQKCYCGTAVCRGWLGEPPDELTKEEKEEERRRNALTAISDKPVDKRTKEDKKQQFDDELQDDLSELRRVGLRNRQYTLMLSRVMVRAESEHTRSQLLVLLQAAHANTPCLRLFMDYHGLSLLWSWMADLSIDLEHAPLKLQILKTLDILPITNRTQVADSRVLEVVEKWSKQTTPPPSTSPPLETKRTAASTTTDTNKKSSDGSEDSDDVTVDDSSQDSVDAPTSGTAKLPSSDDSSSDSNSSKRFSILSQKSLVDGEALPQKPQLLAQKEDLLRKAQTEMVELAVQLVTRWQVLKEEFRIPRKQRVQLMKEHEREVEAGYRRYLDTERGRREVMESRYNTRRDSYYDSWRCKIVPDHDKDGRRWQANDTAISINDAEFAGLSKEERREKFAQKVAIEDEQRRVQEGMWNVHVERCARSGLDPYQTPIIDPSGQYYWDSSNSTWVPLTPQTAYAAGVMDPATAQQHVAAMTAMAGGDPSLCYPIDMEPETAVNPHCIPTVNGEVLQPVVVTINLPPHWHIARDQYNRVYFYHSRSRQTQWDIPTLDTKTTLQYETDSESDSESSSSSDESTRIGGRRRRDQRGSPLPQPTLERQPAVASFMRARNLYKGQWITLFSICHRLSTEQHFLKTAPVLSQSEEEFSSDEGDDNDDEVAMASADGEANNEEPETVEGKIIRRQRGRKRHSEALVQQRVISPIRELDREQARKERREAKERARHEARRERLQYQEQLLSKELGVAEEDDSDADQETIIEEPKMLYPPRDKFKVKPLPPPEGRSKERAATAIADTSDKARKIKDLFRSRMATFIVSVLNPYRRVDCKQGRINTTEDFKYLARKLTHFVMVKELKQLPSIEGLDCSDSVKHKTKDFVRKYMAKYGSSFKRDPNDTKEY